MSFKVTDFGTNQKPICDFLRVINSNLPPILQRFQVMADVFFHCTALHCVSFLVLYCFVVQGIIVCLAF